MKKVLKLAVSALMIFTAGAVSPTKIEGASENNSKTVMYRLYNPNSGEHFYTADYSERNHIIDAGWQFEGVGWDAPSNGNPVYRLYNANGGEHHYTLNKKERDALVTAGWRYEGIGWQSGGNIPVYREYNPNAYSCNHNYTTSRKEHDFLISIGWRNEGIGWYASQPVASTIEDDDNATVSVSADIKMTGTGDGYHSKVVMNSANGSLASFGIQYDTNASGKPGCRFLLENIMSQASKQGLEGKRYLYAGDAQAGRTYNIRLSWYKNSNELVGYVDGVEVIRDRTTFQIMTGQGQNFALAIEGDVKHTGDTIDATYTHIKARSSIDPKIGGILYGWKFTGEKNGIHIQVTDPGKGVKNGAFDTGESNSGQDASMHIYGKGNNGIAGHDWDWVEFYAHASATTHSKLPGQATKAQTRDVIFEPGAGATVSPKKITPIANTNAGNLPGPVEGLETGELPVPERYGYQFAGWYTDPVHMDDYHVFTKTSLVTDNITVYAKWIRKTQATVIFDKNCDDLSVVAPENVTTGTTEPIGSLPVISREGYEFAGWYDQPEGGEEIGTDHIFGDDTTLYAHWIKNTSSEPESTLSSQ